MILIDFMHVSCIGTIETILKLWLTEYRNTENIKNDWYLDSSQRKEIVERIKKVKYTNESPRLQRSFSDINNFKANEFRNILFYTAIPCFIDIVDKKIFTHLALYITSMRIFTKQNISKENIEDAHLLISHFIFHFKTIYKEEKMDYKLHAHIHFANQVINYGGLNETNSFAFEAMLKESATFIQGLIT